MRNRNEPGAVDTASAFDIDTIKEQARREVRDGAVTSDYDADREAVLAMLDGALATELTCVLRYRRHYFMAQGMASKEIAAEFLEHSNEELSHADQIARRITQLGGAPDLDPSRLTSRSHADYVECRTLEEMVTENLVAERIAIATYRQMIRDLGDRDPTTRRLLEAILEVEERHAEELDSLLPPAR
jgi:bacterioferritin